ncbi:Uncharacterised protein [Vibrio cholerae]|nr:Uncharacterised protein [Vibrio cholerae]
MQPTCPSLVVQIKLLRLVPCIAPALTSACP